MRGIRQNRPLSIAAILIALFSIHACMLNNSRERFDDFSTNGFMSDDCYQSILEFPTDRDLQGLVKQREAAMDKAKSRGAAESMVLDRLLEYTFDNAVKSASPEAIKAANMPDLKQELRQRLRSFLSRGRVVYSYYNEDNSAVIIYRIERSGLKGRLDSMEVFREPEVTVEKNNGGKM